MVRQNIQNRLPKLEDELKDTEREHDQCNEEYVDNEEQCEEEEEEQSPLFPFKQASEASRVSADKQHIFTLGVEGGDQNPVNTFQSTNRRD